MHAVNVRNRPTSLGYRSRMKRAAALAAAAILVSACGGAAQDAAPAPTPAPAPAPAAGGETELQDVVVRIGLVGPLTGGGAALGTRAVNGAKLALDQVNASGGIVTATSRITFEYVVADNKTNAAEAVTQIRRLVEVDKVDAIVGGTLSDITLAMIEVAEELKTPMIVSGAISPAIPQTIKERGWRYIFMSSPVAADRAAADATSIHELLTPSKVAIVAQETAYGVPIAEAFIAQLKALNPAIEVTENYVDRGTTDYGAVIGRLRDQQPDIVYAPLVGPEMYSFMNQIRERGLETLVYGASSDPASQTFIDQLKDVANRTMMNLVWVPTTGNPLIEAFTADYQRVYGTTPADVEAQAYDATLALLQAIERTDAGGKEAYADALLEVELDGVRGPQRFEADDHSTRNLSFVVAQIQDGQYVRLWPSASATGPIQR
jgi:branched-chain amino acid transport system substrate-binding protein